MDGADVCKPSPLAHDDDLRVMHRVDRPISVDTPLPRGLLIYNDMQSCLKGVPLYFSYHRGGLRSLGRWLYYVAVWLLVFLSLVLLVLQYSALPASKAAFIFQRFHRPWCDAFANCVL